MCAPRRGTRCTCVKGGVWRGQPCAHGSLRKEPLCTHVHGEHRGSVWGVQGMATHTDAYARAHTHSCRVAHTLTHHTHMLWHTRTHTPTSREHTHARGGWRKGGSRGAWLAMGICLGWMSVLPSKPIAAAILHPTPAVNTILLYNHQSEDAQRAQHTPTAVVALHAKPPSRKSTETTRPAPSAPSVGTARACTRGLACARAPWGACNCASVRLCFLVRLCICARLCFLASVHLCFVVSLCLWAPVRRRD